MSVVLKDMNFADYSPFMKMTIDGFIQDKIRNKQWLPEEAEKNAKEAFDLLLPKGFDTQDQHFHIITSNRNKAGYLWFETRQTNGLKVIFINFIYILPDFRKKGIAKAALDRLKQMAIELKAQQIELHVFGFNTEAIQLYLHAGFVQTNIMMRCEL